MCEIIDVLPPFIGQLFAIPACCRPHHFVRLLVALLGDKPTGTFGYNPLWFLEDLFLSRGGEINLPPIGEEDQRWNGNDSM
jgi:hypothetical protein